MHKEPIRYLSEHLLYKGDILPPWQEVENAVTRLILLSYQDRELDAAWTTHWDEQNGVAVAITHREFIQQNAEFVPVYIQARLNSVPIFRQTVQKFVMHGFPEFANLEEVFLPIICFSVHSSDLDAAFSTPGFSQVLPRALKDITYWKASSHLLFADAQDPDHDFPEYATKTATELGLTVLDFLTIQTSHENNHLLLDAIIGTMFGEYATWLQEGACEYFTGLEGRAVNLIKDYKKMNSSMTVLDILNNTSFAHKYGGGYLLIKCIASAYHADDRDKGAIQFLKKLYDLKSKVNEPLSLATATEQVLKEDNLFDFVIEMFNSEFVAIG